MGRWKWPEKDGKKPTMRSAGDAGDAGNADGR